MCASVQVCKWSVTWPALLMAVLVLLSLRRFQELDLSAEALLLNDSSREEDWIRGIQAGLNQRSGSRYHKVPYVFCVHAYS